MSAERMPQAPYSVRKSNAIVVGAGPTGLLSALLLAQRGVSVTLLDASTTHPSVHGGVPRSQLLTRRAMSVVRMVPGLEERLMAAGQPVDALRVAALSPEGAIRLLCVPDKPDGDGERLLYILRNDLCRVLTERAVEDDARIIMRFGAEVTNTVFTEDGFIHLTLRSGAGRESLLSTHLLIAADGRSSKIAKALRDLHRPHHSCLPPPSDARAQRQRWRQAIGDVQVERVTLTRNARAAVAARLAGGQFGAVMSFCLLSSDGDARLAASPVGSVGRVSVSGWPGVLVARATSVIWKARTKNALRFVLHEQFPQVQGPVIDDESLERVIGFGGMQLGIVKRAWYTGTEIGKDGKGGVICIGGAGQKHEGGPDSSAEDGFEDVRRMMLVLDTADDNVDVREIAWQYDVMPIRRSRLIKTAVRQNGSCCYPTGKFRRRDEQDQVVVLANVGCLVPISSGWSSWLKLMNTMYEVGEKASDPTTWGILGAALVFLGTAVMMKMRKQG